jgi:predicted nucleic acid-binding protein
LNLVDSSAWLEYFANGRNAGVFAPAIEDASALLVSTINCYEVFKRVAQQRDEDAAIQAISVMQQGIVVEVSVEIAIVAAQLALEARLPMADGIILATARLRGATLWTQDADFAGMPSVKYVAKR